MPDPMAAMLATKFIQRRDAKAQQKSDGEYAPVCDWYKDEQDRWQRGHLYPFQMSDLEAHLAGTATFGHYLIDQQDRCKLFAFDIDLEKAGSWVQLPDLTHFEGDLTEDQYREMLNIVSCNPREAWLNRAHPGRPWFKWQLRFMAERLSRTIFEKLDLPVACAYSGSKGVHVYGFLPRDTSAQHAREAAEVTLSLAGGFELFRGKNFYRTTDQDPFTGFPNLSIEIFPKQGSLEGKDLGNLMRLPLGRNLKSPDPAFFLDQRAPQGQLVPHPDPIALLTSGNPWL